MSGLRIVCSRVLGRTTIRISAGLTSWPFLCFVLFILVSVVVMFLALMSPRLASAKLEFDVQSHNIQGTRSSAAGKDPKDDRFYLQRIPDVDFWPNLWLPGGSRARARHAHRVVKDPRLTMHDATSKNWEKPMKVSAEDDPLRLFTNPTIAMDDPKLIAHIREHVLVPPSRGQFDYQLEDFDQVDHSEFRATSEIIFPILKGLGMSEKTVFFEAGGLDGEIASRTLYLERFHRWNGLVAEMTYPNARRFIKKRRKTWFAPVCVSPEARPLKKQMRLAYDRGDPWAERTGTINKKKFDLEDSKDLGNHTYVYALVDCYPLYSLLLAANMTEVDFLALDLEGVELQVLKTLPFDRVKLRMVVVEIYHTEEGRGALREFMVSKGFWSTRPHQNAGSMLTKNEREFYDSHLVFLDGKH